MDILILIMSIICFILSLWWVVADVTGGMFLKFLFKGIAIVGCVIPIIYWLKLLNVI